MKFSLIVLQFALVASAQAQLTTEVVCSYTPSQSNIVATVSGAAGGVSATVSAIATATGLAAVPHSSGALILTGSSGYIAGTIGGAATAPVIVSIGLAVGGAAVALELVCAKKNYPKEVARVEEAANEFSRRFTEVMKKTEVATGDLKKTIAPAASRAKVEVKRISGDVLEYAYRASAEARILFPK